MTRSITDFISQRKAPTKTVVLYMDGDGASELRKLEQELIATKLREARGETGLRSDVPALERRVQEKRAEIDASKFEMTFAPIGRAAYDRLVDDNQEGKDLATPEQRAAGQSDDAFNHRTFPPALIAASCIDPVMTPDEADALWEVISFGEGEVLFAAAMSLQWEKPAPFTHGGSDKTPPSEANSTTATTTDSHTASS